MLSDNKKSQPITDIAKQLNIIVIKSAQIKKQYIDMRLRAAEIHRVLHAVRRNHDKLG